MLIARADVTMRILALSVRFGSMRRCTNCRGLILLGAVERRGALVVGMREVILGSFERVARE